MNAENAATLGGSKAHRIFVLLKDAITSGRMGAGDILPGELKLAEQYGVSRVTVRRAMEALREAGLIERKPGVGTVVVEPKLGGSVLSARVSDLLPSMRKMSQASQVRLLEFAYVPASDHVQSSLKLAAGSRVQRSVRVRLMDNTPFSYLITHVPEQIALHYNETDLSHTALFVLLERSGVKLDHASQTISAALATHDVAQALGVTVGSPLISMTRVVFDEQGRGVELLEALYRPDRYRIQIDLCRSGEDENRFWSVLDGEPEEEEG